MCMKVCMLIEGVVVHVLFSLFFLMWEEYLCVVDYCGFRARAATR